MTETLLETPEQTLSPERDEKEIDIEAAHAAAKTLLSECGITSACDTGTTNVQRTYRWQDFELRQHGNLNASGETTWQDIAYFAFSEPEHESPTVFELAPDTFSLLVPSEHAELLGVGWCEQLANIREELETRIGEQRRHTLATRCQSMYENFSAGRRKDGHEWQSFVFYANVPGCTYEIRHVGSDFSVVRVGTASSSSVLAWFAYDVSDRDFRIINELDPMCKRVAPTIEAHEVLLFDAIDNRLIKMADRPAADENAHTTFDRQLKAACMYLFSRGNNLSESHRVQSPMIHKTEDGHEVSVELIENANVYALIVLPVSEGAPRLTIAIDKTTNQISDTNGSFIQTRTAARNLRPLLGLVPQALHALVDDRQPTPEVIVEPEPEIEFDSEYQAAISLTNFVMNRARPERTTSSNLGETHMRRTTIEDRTLRLRHTIVQFGHTASDEGGFVPLRTQVHVERLADDGPVVFDITDSGFASDNKTWRRDSALRPDDVFESFCRHLLAEDMRLNGAVK